MGHVPTGSFPAEGHRAHLPRRQHRGTRTRRSDLSRLARTGRLAEDIAADFLRDRGAEVVATNLRVGRGEVDLVVEFPDGRAVVEVKSRWGGDSDPAEALTPAKARQVTRLAAELDPPVYRVDLITVWFSDDGAMVRWVPLAA